MTSVSLALVPQLQEGSLKAGHSRSQEGMLANVSDRILFHLHTIQGKVTTQIHMASAQAINHRSACGNRQAV
jgi:hypothetical protein